jgi:HEAT repeat protein
MPNRLGSAAKREQKADEKVRKAEEKFNESVAAKQRKLEKKAQRLAEKKSIVANQFDAVEETLLPAAHETRVRNDLGRNASMEGIAYQLDCVKGIVLSDKTNMNSESDRNVSMDVMPIDVLVQCMTGEEFWLTPLPDISIAALKDMLSEVWGIPPACQRLLVDCTMLLDSELLHHRVRENDNVLNVTAVVVIGEVREASVLAKLALRGEGLVAAVCDAMGNEDEGTRYQLFVEVRKLAKQEDARAIAVLIEIMNHATLPSTRTEILGTLACIGLHLDQAKDAIIAQLQHPEACVRIAALHAIAHVSTNTSQRTLCVVSECLEDELEEVRFQAVQALINIAETTDSDAVSIEVKKRLAHERSGVRRAAVQALTHIMARGNDQSVCAEILFLPLLQDYDPDVRAAVVQAIDHIAPQGSQVAFGALVGVLFDSDWCVRQLTLRALRRFERPDIRSLILSAGPYLYHQDAMMRCTAVEALGTIKDSLMDQDVLSSLKCLFMDNDVLVSSAVSRLLGECLQ